MQLEVEEVTQLEATAEGFEPITCRHAAVLLLSLRSLRARALRKGAGQVSVPPCSQGARELTDSGLCVCYASK